MRCGRTAVAAQPAPFGRKASHCERQGRTLFSAEDVRLFLTTFAAGFAFVALFIA